MSDRALRLFVALELPGEATRALEAFAEAAADPEVWRRVPAESLHVTLAFLGRTEAALVPSVAGTVAGVWAAPRLALGDALLLPPRRARVLCAALVDPDGALAAVQADVAARLAATGAFTAEARAFRPHVTVARLRPRARPPRRVEAAPEPVSFHGMAVTLFSSHTSPHGARYEALARTTLSPGRTAD